MSTPKREAFIALRDAVEKASELGVFDELQAFCEDPDSINDVCDAIDDMEYLAKLSEPEKTS